MRQRPLPGTPLRLSEVGFGVWTVSTGWWGQYTDDQAIALMRRALDLGITFYDTGDTYGNGRGETLLGRALGDRRGEIAIGTKFGYDFYNHPGPRTGQQELPQNWSPAFVRMALEKSLERLGTDHVDLYQMHNPRIEALRDPALLEVLDTLREEGKIRATGAALGPAIQERQIEEGLRAIEAEFPAVQIIYNMLEPMLGDALCPRASTSRTRFLVRVPHASGMLEGRITGKEPFAKGDHRYHRMSDPARQQMWEQMRRKVERLEEFLTHDMTIAQAALQYILAEPTVASVLPNIYGEEQLEEFTAVTRLRGLTRKEMEQIRDLQRHNFHLEETAAPASR